MNRKMSPFASIPEPNALVSEVTVWEAEPVFFQQTVVPGATVLVPDENEKSTMLICVSPGSQEAAARADVSRPDAGSTARAARIANTTAFRTSTVSTVRPPHSD